MIGKFGFFTGVILPWSHLILTIFAGCLLWTNDHCYWSILTVASLFIPGILEIIYYVGKLCRKQISGFEGFIGIIEAIVFPLSYPIRRTCTLFNYICGCNEWLNRNWYSHRTVVNCLDALTDAAFQSILQVVIILHNLQQEKFQGKEWLECFLIIVSLMTVALACSELHCHQKTAKQSIPPESEIRTGLAYYFMTGLSRILILGLLAAYLKGYIFVVLSLIVLCNLLLSTLILRKKRASLSKDVMTAFASVTVPAAFVSSPDLRRYNLSAERTGCRFFRFHCWNNACFCVIALASTILTFSLYVPHANSTLPIVSCLSSSLPFCHTYDWPVCVALLGLAIVEISFPFLQNQVYPQFFNVGSAHANRIEAL